MNEITSILLAVERGDPKAANELLPLVYDELRKLAAQKLAQEKPGQTLQATALVHEAYLRLVGTDDPSWNSRGHFFAAAAEAMRRILVENARRKKRLKRGGDRQRVDIDEMVEATDLADERILVVDEALDRLNKEDPLAAQLVKLRFFAGMSITDAAGTLGISRASAYEQWAYARAWLRCAVEDSGAD
jgi:RNA polymerase sigma factor (TIGR02999 family)